MWSWWNMTWSRPPGAITELARRPHPLCAWAYALTWTPADPAWVAIAGDWHAALLQAHPLIADRTAELNELASLQQRPGGGAPAGSTWVHRVITDPVDPARHQRWVRRGERWAHLVGFGCTKISPAACNARTPPPGGRAPGTTLTVA
ncbi:MAG: hypothetical protein M0Z54_00705 [Thermaerobacter sp.]|nr:hypothetical protein [Thermaerobacter sp.]